MPEATPPPLRILVTGASGFIGRTLVPHLAQAGHAVLAVSRAPVAVRPGVRAAQVMDYDDAATLRGLARGCDCVIHLAAIAHRAVKGPASLFEPNVAATRALVAAAAAAGVRRFVLVSSIGVNGNRTQGRPFTESDPPAPVEPYAASKLQCEQVLLEAARQHPALEWVIVRPPLVYGPHAPGNISRLWRAVAGRSWLPLGAVGHNRRSFIGVDNLADLLELCARLPAARNELFLAADGDDVSTRELVLRMGRALHVQPRLIPAPVALLRLGAALAGRRDVVDRVSGSLQVDAGKARRVLGWVPPLSLDEGLARAAAAERSARAAP